MGSIESVLLLHGQPGSGQDWDLVLENLGARAAGDHNRHVVAIAPDRPGYDRVSTPTGIAGNAAWTVQQLDRQGFEQVTLVGLSLGAAIAAWVASEWPERVRKLVLVSPAANRASLVATDRLLAAPMVGHAISDGLLIGAGIASRSGWLRKQLDRRFGVPADYLLHAGDDLLRRSVRRAFLVEQRAAITELPLLERRLGAIVAPTTIVEGSDDRVVPPDAVRELTRQIKHARFVKIEGGHHLLTMTHPARIAELIVEHDHMDDRADANQTGAVNQ